MPAPGTPVPAENGIPPGVYKREHRPAPDAPGRHLVLVKLPPEYHHGRAYPVLIVLTHPGVDAEQVLGSLAHEADRNGYILLAPEWASLFGKGWQWNGEDHVYVTAVLRDAVRHFCVDNDRVFLFGARDGANMAMDVGMSHPDLFAGVLAMGPIPKWQNLFIEYWRNAQKLPFYCVTGELSGDSAGEPAAHLRASGCRKGFPASWSVYKGRGIEWYASEMPVMFDWMGRKKRTSAGPRRWPWATCRGHPWRRCAPTDNRFYWLGVDKIAERTVDRQPAPGQQISPATIQGDIKGQLHHDPHAAAYHVSRSGSPTT